MGKNVSRSVRETRDSGIVREIPHFTGRKQPLLRYLNQVKKKKKNSSTFFLSSCSFGGVCDVPWVHPDPTLPLWLWNKVKGVLQSDDGSRLSRPAVPLHAQLMSETKYKRGPSRASQITAVRRLPTQTEFFISFILFIILYYLIL